MSANTPAHPRRPTIDAEVLGGIVLAIVFGGAFWLARGWDRQAAIFPLGVSAAGFLLAIALTVRALTSRRMRAEAETPHEEIAADDNLEYIFQTATARQWIVTLAWFGGFFVALYVLGLYASALIFTVAYLRTQDRRSWLFVIVYALVLVAVLYGAFTVLLAKPVPPGFFGLV
ncbi:MAG: hypothetical protein JWN22_1448 [Nocardioides sp.]|jgi:hypothetical protein|nr:hypothetical protein [Nocardioides sp.]